MPTHAESQHPEPSAAAQSSTWPRRGSPEFVGGNRVRLLQGGDEMFPAMCRAITNARHQIWLATYIFHDDDAARQVALALAEAGRRGVRVGVVVDGFGSKGTLHKLREWMPAPQVDLALFRPVDRWWSLLQPGQLRRLHQKLCVVDRDVCFVGGINVIDDRNDLRHGMSDTPRLDFAIALQGPLVAAVEQTARAIWSRAALGAEWRDEVVALARSAEPVARARRMLQRLRIVRPSLPAPAPAVQPPVRAAFLVRDNLRQRRAIERAYVEAVSHAKRSVELITPYFYPGRVFRRALVHAAQRGVRVRLLLQGKIDYRFAAMAAQVLYDEMRSQGVNAKVAVVDDDWATVGSSNIDPLSLLLNLEANVIVRDAEFAAELSSRFDAAVAMSHEVADTDDPSGWARTLRRGFVAWCAHWFLRMAGITGRY
jgi:cardiolipin synthase